MALLEVSDVTVRFGGILAVDGATLTADAGRVTGLIGPNGAGKTTVFNVISGLQEPVNGRVVLDGQDVTKLGPFQRARLGMARTFQRLEAFGSLSVWDNVLTAAEIHDRWRKDEGEEPADVARRLIDRVGLSDWAAQPADAVPTGTARLLEVARALAIEPRVLLLDEPSSGLGEDETDTFGELLRELAEEGRAVFMVEHDMDLVMGVCDVIHVFDFGKSIMTGTPDEVRADERVQKAYLGASGATPELAAAARGGKGATDD